MVGFGAILAEVGEQFSERSLLEAVKTLSVNMFR